jgi:hypothetical protein
MKYLQGWAEEPPGKRSVLVDTVHVVYGNELTDRSPAVPMVAACGTLMRYVIKPLLGKSNVPDLLQRRMG